MWSALRVPTPALQPSQELRWVLLRAFAPSGACVPRAIDAAKIVSISCELDLAARIATRHFATLPDELGHEAAQRLSFERLRVIAVDRVLWALGDEILHTARTLACPVVWMKHAALRRSRRVAEGERSARDVDLLVPEANAEGLQRALTERGFRGGPLTPQYHLPPLQRAPGEVVEIHTALGGIRLSNQAPHHAAGASASHLLAGGYVHPVAQGSYVPTQAMLAAHAIVHGLVQHRTSPEGYPMMRVLSDLCSLAPLEASAFARCQAYAAPAVGDELTCAAVRLSEALLRGADTFSLPQGSPELELLSHVIAAGIDPAYRRALRFERVFDLARSDGMKRAFRSAFSSSESMAQREGAPKALRRLSVRVAKPVALALELARSGASFGGLHFRRSSR